uniref:probable serine/threonine-protein kinase At1g01540 n=1 Tax=Erigeron canadensis TaxID=72917 RepID=UPI001CB98BA9|nr:probable serine/threonine-protein kinase At1g01540 [Erigeron canadensis]
MSMSASSLTGHLFDQTPFFGLKLWMIIIICIGLVTAILLFAFLCLWSFLRRQKKKLKSSRNPSGLVMERRLLPQSGWDIGTQDERVLYSDRHNWWGSGGGSIHLVDHHNNYMQSRRRSSCGTSSSSAWRCMNYNSREIDIATNGFGDGSVIASGEYGVMAYRGILFDGKRVAVKKLINISTNDEEFIEQVEAIWCIRHVNLVKLLGYSIEGDKRMLVYEYVNNGNLHQWLHGSVARVSSLTWNIRMNIILGITKGLVYLHEDCEPIVIHQQLRSSSILVDHRWNPRISNVGTTRLLDLGPTPSTSHPLTGMSGYIAPEYVYTRALNEKTDMYSFGVLIMEIISGRAPVEYKEFGRKEYLVDWIKSKVSNQNFDDIVDARLHEPPSLTDLKRMILIALRCVDSDVENRPKIGDVIHMLEPRDLLLNDVSFRPLLFFIYLSVDK